MLPAASAQTAPGPLCVLPSNPRWFADPSGRAVLLAGSHVWRNLQDSGLLFAEEQFRRVEGYRDIPQLAAAIQALASGGELPVVLPPRAEWDRL